MDNSEHNVERLEWSIDVPIFKNSIILKQLGVAIGIPFGLLLIFFIVVSKPEHRTYMFYAIGVIFLLFSLTYLLIMGIYKGKYSVNFILDQKEIQCLTQPDMVKKNNIINGLTIGLGLLAGKPSVSGAGLLANSKQSVSLQWKNITKANYKPNQKTIMLRTSPIENIAVFCTEENYSTVETFIKGKLSRSDVNP